ncbi:MAG: lipoprotein-releasing system transmembrane subunit LolC, partial [Alphaproteobacteria bacterium]|nr:lipoprotein-releasing system transmembrane subunit LolC [Alphaproteobacteria bacterium]
MFSTFEWMMALRYLRARREEGLISVIAVFSLLGIMIGVATLIIVPAVMNGFRAELLERILGVNGHILVNTVRGPLAGFDELKGRLAGIDGVVRIAPLVEGQGMAPARGRARGALVRGVR